MARRSDHAILRLGTVCLLVLLVVMAAAFNLQKFPGFRGTGYHAEFKDASGLHEGNMVQIAGVRVGRINDVRITGGHVTIDFDVHGAEFGPDSRASVEVLNLLGEKYLEIRPEGSGTMAGGGTIPVSHTIVGYDIVGTLGELTDRTEKIDVGQLSKALTSLGDTLDAAAPEVRSSFRGLSRISRTIASRDEGMEQLLHRADRVTRLLNDRKGDLVTLMKQGDLVFRELIARRDAIHELLVNARRLGVQLRGVARDNQAQIGPALAELHTAVTFLQARRDQLQKTIHNLGPYASILINIVGTGPWFDAYVPNFGGLATGEFVPGPRKE
jgi:phospholipid/cholesterol/gamma-HCH transport system substrate-binding protein